MEDKKETLERQFRAIKALFTRYNKEILDPKNKARRGFQKIAFAKLVDDLNTQISGAIFRNKKIGFTFYFSKITTVKQLHQLDAYVEENMQKMKLRSLPNHKIKSHIKAYYAWRSDEIDSYILNYDNPMSTVDKFQYLKNRDFLSGSARKYSAAYVNSLYERYIRIKLKRISDFTGNLS